MINIEYIWNEKLALDSAKEIYEYELENSRKKYIGWFFIALLQFGVVSALKHNSYGFLTIATIGLIYWYGFRWDVRKFFIKRTFKKSPFANKRIKLIAKEDGVYDQNNKLQFKYNDIHKFVKLENGIALYTNIGTIYIPNNAFKSQKDKEEFPKLIKNS